MKINRNAKHILTAVIIIGILFFAYTLNKADSDSFNITTSTSNTKIGGKLTIAVTGTNVVSLYAYEVNLTFDEGLLNLINVVSNIEGYSIPAQINGNKVKFAMTKTGDKPPESGDLTLCTLTFEAKATGTAVVTLDSVKIMDEILNESNYFINESITINISKYETPPPPPTTDPTLPTPPTTEPDISTPPTTEPDPTLPPMIEAVLDDNGIAVASITTDDFEAAAYNEKDKIIYFKIQAAEDVNCIKVIIPAEEVRAMEEDKLLKIDTHLAVVTFSSNYLKKIITPSSENIELTISKSNTEELLWNIKDIIGNNSIYTFNLSVDGVLVNNFSNGEKAIIIEVGYKLKPGEDLHKVIVYNIDDNNNELAIEKNGMFDADMEKVRFCLPYFSGKYAVAYIDVTFNDIENVLWAKESIEALAARGIINGIGDGAFNPNGNVTRAEFIKMLMEAFDLVDETAECEFSDVKEGAWYYRAIASAWKLGIVKGKGDGTFGVSERISREDMAVMAYRTAKLAKIKLEGSGTDVFEDREQISAYAIEAVETMHRAGIISGVGGGRFAPKDGATRAQAAIIVYRILSLV
ncbi:MAG TPA: hypothetical protein GXX14_10710 [Clostridiaceae bacterium]|nr:hypothetical protein [Clostridiaceae bacterium]